MKVFGRDAVLARRLLVLPGRLSIAERSYVNRVALDFLRMVPFMAVFCLPGGFIASAAVLRLFPWLGPTQLR